MNLGKFEAQFFSEGPTDSFRFGERHPIAGLDQKKEAAADFKLDFSGQGEAFPRFSQWWEFSLLLQGRLEQSFELSHDIGNRRGECRRRQVSLGSEERKAEKWGAERKPEPIEPGRDTESQNQTHADQMLVVFATEPTMAPHP